MAIPEIKAQDIIAAFKFIDENGIPPHNQSTKYDLVTDEGKKYPPKYVIAVARHLATGEDIAADDFNADEAKNFLQKQGYAIEAKQTKFELTISAEDIVSTDERFTMDNLSLGDNYKPLGVFFRKADGQKIMRSLDKGERRISNQTMPRLACQVFEKQLAAMPEESRESFPVCKYNPSSETICGIYTSAAEYKAHRNSIDYLVYGYGDGRQFVFHCWNIFSTVVFVQECLKRFGEPGDQMVLTYREKDAQEEPEDTAETATKEVLVQQFKGYRNPFSSMLIESKNLIFRGAGCEVQVERDYPHLFK